MATEAEATEEFHVKNDFDQKHEADPMDKLTSEDTFDQKCPYAFSPIFSLQSLRLLRPFNQVTLT